ncbi:MAG TPA: cbb3-type cytochrome c oxidase N-terminal domain-containing protein [Myxococcales bacterium]|jgi:cytochrome c oxidase cbb3-type subunit 3
MTAATDQPRPPEAPASDSQAHSVHDGIEEHDNHLPRWWLLTLFGAIVFSFGYWFYYQHLTGPGQRAELAADERMLADLREKALSSKITDEGLLAMSKDGAVVARGAELFKANCIACHEAKGQGKIGPNLTDAYWIHGGKPTQIFKTVIYGVPDKGMLSWGPVLGAAKSQDVVAFVLTLKNTNVQGKEPQGAKEE